MKMMRFMTQHPMQSHDPTRASLAIVYHGMNFQRVTLLARDMDKWYQIIERDTSGYPQILLANDCKDRFKVKYMALSVLMNTFFMQVFEELQKQCGNYVQIAQKPPRFNIAQYCINLSKYDLFEFSIILIIHKFV